MFYCVQVVDKKCRFDVDLEDASGSTVGIIMGRYGENILSLTAAEVYKIVSVKKEPMPLQEIQSCLSHKLFKIQAKKLLARHPASVRKLFVISCVEKSNAPCSLPTRSSTDVGEGSKRKKDCLLLSDEETEFPPKEVGSLKIKNKRDPTSSLKTK